MYKYVVERLREVWQTGIPLLPLSCSLIRQCNAVSTVARTLPFVYYGEDADIHTVL